MTESQLQMQIIALHNLAEINGLIELKYWLRDIYAGTDDLVEKFCDSLRAA